jgi:amidohydrolase
MQVLPEIAAQADTLAAIRRDIHAHPELGFEEVRTAALVAERLRAWGVDEVHEGVGGTGVVGLIRGSGDGNRRVGLRADMDALPIEEASGVDYASSTPGVMHACGHDGHTTIVLGAAQYLAATRRFSGTAVMIFQPAEEGRGGARKMLDEGLFTRFPCDEIYGIHNTPGMAPGTVTVTPGPAMAGATLFDVVITGRGGHAAMPHQGRDPVVAGASLVGELQTIISRNLVATRPAVLSVTRFLAGTAYNVIPDRAVLSGTIRYFDDADRDLIHRRIEEICAGLARVHEVRIEPDLRAAFSVLENDPELSREYIAAAADVVGADGARISDERRTGSEDFADMLRVVPGAYCRIGHSGSVPLHNPAYVFGDDCLPVGASVMARIVERRLPL